MAGLLESSQTVEQVAPDWYKTYLSGLAGQGTAAAANAQFVGATPLQQQAFDQVGGASSAYQPTLAAATNTLGQASGSTNPLGAAQPYLQAAGTSPAQLAQSYMNPYTQSVVNNIGDLGQRNIQQNLVPQANAGAAGSGQFGSQRSAQVMGQSIANANRDVLNAQQSALQTGYGQALTAAGQQNQLQGQLGQTAASAASQGQQNLTQAGQAQGQLAKVNQELNLGNIGALSTYGGQQQTIAQNQQQYPLTNLSALSGILRGYNVPETTKTTAQLSPLAAATGLLTTGGALMSTGQPLRDAKGNIVLDPNGKPVYAPSQGSQLYKGLSDFVGKTSSALGGIFNSPNPNPGGNPTPVVNPDPNYDAYDLQNTPAINTPVVNPDPNYDAYDNQSSSTDFGNYYS